MIVIEKGCIDTLNYLVRVEECCLNLGEGEDELELELEIEEVDAWLLMMMDD